MKTSVNIFKYKNTPISFDLLILLIFLFVNPLTAFIIIISIIIHEVAHGYIAIKRGYGLDKIHIGVFVSYASILNIKNIKDDLVITLAGPVSNFLLAFVSVIFLVFLENTIFKEFFAQLVVLNLIFGTINMIPILPLDGGHILKDILLLRGKENALLITHRVSIIVAFLLLWLTLSYGLFILSIILFFAIFNSYKEIRKK